MLRRAVKVAAAVGDIALRGKRGVVVLIYHRVGAKSRMEVDLPLDLFHEQMVSLAASGRVVTLDRALAALDSSHPPDRDPIVITFDDGTADFAQSVLPILAGHRLPVTLYVATDFIERGVRFPNNGQPLSWQELSDAYTTGLLTVGSHTHTHALLDRLVPRAVEDELDRSIGLIGDRLGIEARHFAYPKAVVGSRMAEDAVIRRFCSAAVSGTKPNLYGRTNPHRLARSPIQTADGMRWFARKVAGGMALEDVLRGILNRRRYRALTS